VGVQEEKRGDAGRISLNPNMIRLVSLKKRPLLIFDTTETPKEDFI